MGNILYFCYYYMLETDFFAVITTAFILRTLSSKEYNKKISLLESFLKEDDVKFVGYYWNTKMKLKVYHWTGPPQAVLDNIF